MVAVDVRWERQRASQIVGRAWLGLMQVVHGSQGTLHTLAAFASTHPPLPCTSRQVAWYYHLVRTKHPGRRVVP